MSVRRRNDGGYSLVELSVVIILIGILAVAVLGGVYIQKRYKLQEVVANVEEINRAVIIFKEKYQSYPGDFWNASAVLPGIVSIQNGDGDDVVERTDLNSETLFLWKHLVASGLIEGGYDAATHERDAGLMPGPLVESSFQVYHRNNGNGMILTAELAKASDANSSSTVQPSLGEADLSLMDPRDVYALDRHYDDGNPSSGKLIGGEGSDSAAGRCVTDPATYTLSNSTPACVVYFELE